jgi:outer membrane protein
MKTLSCKARRASAPAILLLLLPLLSLLLGATANARATDLLSVYRLAQGRDPVFAAARHALDMASHKPAQAWAAVLPSVSLAGNGGLQSGAARFPANATASPYARRSVDHWSLTLQLSQPLLPVANWLGIGVADAQWQQAQAEFEQAHSELILRVAQAYFDLLGARDGVALARGQWQAMEQQRVLARRRREAGEATVTDVHEAQSRRDLAQAQLVQAGNEHEAKRAELERIVGEPAQSMAGLAPAFVLPPPAPAQVGAWVAQAVVNNPAARARRAALSVAEREISQRRAAHLPTLDLTAGYGASFASGSLGSPADVGARTRSGTVGLQLTVPLYQGGGATARVREAIANRERAAAQAEAASRHAAMLARQSYGAVVSGMAQVDALASAVVSSRDAVEANRIGYRIGTRLGIDVLNAEQQLFAALRDVAKARYETILHGLRLKAAAGVLDETDLIALNALLDPDATAADGMAAAPMPATTAD